MGGSPKLAVDNIREILNINQQRSDYLGEPRRRPQLCCPCRGRREGGGLLAFISSEDPVRRQLRVMLKSLESNQPVAAALVSSVGCGRGGGQVLPLLEGSALGPTSDAQRFLAQSNSVGNSV